MPTPPRQSFHADDIMLSIAHIVVLSASTDGALHLQPEGEAYQQPTLASIRSRPLEGGVWHEERVEQTYIHNVVRLGDVVLEIGSNIGRSSIMATFAAGPTGRVIASEADPSRRAVAARNAAGLSSVEFISAISDTPLTLAVGDLAASTSHGGNV